MDKNFNPDRYPIMAAMFRDYARALAEAGLLAPDPLEGVEDVSASQEWVMIPADQVREEWAQRWVRRSGEVRVMKAESREHADPGGERGVEAVHRFVSDWLPADMDDAEGDGRAEG
ncbi:hypothetical protein [Dietzia cercidiphylli]|nr:hypothetical protein [Dietzia cercidiphylli]MBB1046443.1 hypothetical protein [Dietzia cercidiphylli]